MKKIEVSDMDHIVKVKQVVKGDENLKFNHCMLNKKTYIKIYKGCSGGGFVDYPTRQIEI